MLRCRAGTTLLRRARTWGPKRTRRTQSPRPRRALQSSGLRARSLEPAPSHCTRDIGTANPPETLHGISEPQMGQVSWLIRRLCQRGDDNARQQRSTVGLADDPRRGRPRGRDQVRRPDDVGRRTDRRRTRHPRGRAPRHGEGASRSSACRGSRATSRSPREWQNYMRISRNAKHVSHFDSITKALRVLGQQRARVVGKMPAADPRASCCPCCGHAWSGKPRPPRAGDACRRHGTGGATGLMASANRLTEARAAG